MNNLEYTTKRLIHTQGLANVALADVCEACGVPVGSFKKLAGVTFTEMLLGLARRGHYGPAVPVTKTRVHPEILRTHILTVALAACKHQHYRSLRRSKVGEAAGVGRANMHRLFPTPRGFSDAVVKEALQRANATVLRQAAKSNDILVRF